MPEVLEPPAATTAPNADTAPAPDLSSTKGPLTVPLGDIAKGTFLDQFKTNLDKANDDLRQQGDKRAAEREEKKQAEAKPPAEPAQKKEEPPKDQKAPLSAKNIAAGDKEKRKWANQPPETREFLTATEAKRAEAFEGKNKTIAELQAELEPLKKELSETRSKMQALPQERDSLRQEVEALRREKDELNGRMVAYDVRQTAEYKSAVADPWKRDVIDVLVDLEKNTGLSSDEAYQAALHGDRAAMNKLAATLEPFDQQQLATAFKTAQNLKSKDAEYAAKGSDAMKEIEERRTKQEQEVFETRKKDVQAYSGKLDEAIATRFPFMKGVEGNPELSSALENAKKQREGFDYAKLTPADQAAVIHSATHAPIIVQVLEAQVAAMQKQMQDKDAEHAEELEEREEKIKALEERVANQNGVVAATNGRDDKGRFSPTKGDMVDTTMASLRGVR